MRNFIYDNMPKSQENIKTIKVHRRNKSELKSYKESQIKLSTIHSNAEDNGSSGSDNDSF